MITVLDAAKRSLELALDDAMDALDELLDEAEAEDDIRVIHLIAVMRARIARLEEMLGAMP